MKEWKKRVERRTKGKRRSCEGAKKRKPARGEPDGKTNGARGMWEGYEEREGEQRLAKRGGS